MKGARVNLIRPADEESAYDALVCFLVMQKWYCTYRADLGSKISLMQVIVR